MEPIYNVYIYIFVFSTWNIYIYIYIQHGTHMYIYIYIIHIFVACYGNIQHRLPKPSLTRCCPPSYVSLLRRKNANVSAIHFFF